MADTEKIVLTEELRTELETVINTYYAKSEAYKTADADKKTYNARLKDLLQQNGITTYTTDEGIKASLSSSNKPTFNEEEMIPYLKSLDIPDLIKTKEYIDMDILEDAIYHNQIDPKSLAPFKSDNITYRLNCSKAKILNE